ncbi:sigma-70 family RNA polymerase sigma factor [Lentisphaera marina]|uniref:RNA polymerase sigma factor n=1 Tax=Lentisphaera marina TaxID=1111041 RepID=UPI002365D843|nr:sigma-70 family RNA polymerase sigma factor [Lentisphaera marina]MDD7983514.1 sigma-70 family RNA polymerase sigma factor [Lentisphaera marina]
MTKNYNTRITLLQRAMNQDDEQAWREFIDVYKNYIYVIIRKMQVAESAREDLLQQVLVKLWQKLPSFEYDKNRAKFRTWIGSVTRNTVVEHIRKQVSMDKKHESAANEKALSYLNSITQPEIEQMAEHEWRLYLTNLAMAKVKVFFSGKALQAFNMSIEGVDNEEIAEQLDLTIGSVYLLKSRVKKRLRDEIKHLRDELE